MQVTVRWRRTEFYTSTITVDDDALLQYQKDVGVPEEEWGQFDGEVVKDFIEAEDPADHLCADPTDWQDADGIVIDEVEV